MISKWNEANVNKKFDSQLDEIRYLKSENIGKRYQCIILS